MCDIFYFGNLDFMQGGAIAAYRLSNIYLQSSTFQFNTASQLGGGLYVGSYVQASLSSATFTNNS
jgi:hypothetical protein